jgi:pyrimidine operon attenuation protein/uracil phosphoribosyltransferase
MEKQVLSAGEMAGLIEKLALECLAEMGPRVAVVGIKKRGAVIARRIAERMRSAGAGDVPLGFLDITLYRDDFSRIGPNPVVSGTEILFDLEERDILLVDDVLYTGRTIRAALDELTDFGRPNLVRLLVLVDRDSRELPIQPDFVGMKAVVARGQYVEVRVAEVDGGDEIVIVEREP